MASVCPGPDTSEWADDDHAVWAWDLGGLEFEVDALRVAALLAAAYPGFWVTDVQILSEPLGLLVLGLLMLVLADLWERPTLARALLTGGLLGALTLVRGEELALLAIAVAPILLLNRRLDVKRRFAFLGAAAAMIVVLVAPWTIHNLGRFEEPVVLSTNGGPTLLAGNCPPSTYGGERIGSFDTHCNYALGLPHLVDGRAPRAHAVRGHRPSRDSQPRGRLEQDVIEDAVR